MKPPPTHTHTHTHRSLSNAIKINTNSNIIPRHHLCHILRIMRLHHSSTSHSSMPPQAASGANKSADHGAGTHVVRDFALSPPAESPAGVHQEAEASSGAEDVKVGDFVSLSDCPPALLCLLCLLCSVPLYSPPNLIFMSPPRVRH